MGIVTTRGMQAGAHGRRSWRASTRLALVVMALTMLLAGCAGAQTPHALPVAAGARDAFPTPPTPPTPPTQVDPLAARNAAMGCRPSAPAPQPGVLYAGLRPGSAGPAPREVALTFDDGPTPYTSPPIFSYLEQSHTPATFFVEGQYVHQWPNLVQREWNDGFAIGVHTWDHPLMTQQSPAQVHHQFADTLAAIHNILGPSACVWLWRPPYADYNASVIKAAISFGLTTITWDDSSSDWTRPGVQQIVHNVLSAMHPSAVVLMHDGPALREQTAAALPLIMEGLKVHGLAPVTLPRLLADGHYPGVSVMPLPLSGVPRAWRRDPDRWRTGALSFIRSTMELSQFAHFARVDSWCVAAKGWQRRVR